MPKIIDPKIKERVLDALKKSMFPTEIAEIEGLHADTVRKWALKVTIPIPNNEQPIQVKRDAVAMFDEIGTKKTVIEFQKRGINLTEQLLAYWRRHRTSLTLRCPSCGKEFASTRSLGAHRASCPKKKEALLQPAVDYTTSAGQVFKRVEDMTDEEKQKRRLDAASGPSLAMRISQLEARVNNLEAARGYLGKIDLGQFVNMLHELSSDWERKQNELSMARKDAENWKNKAGKLNEDVGNLLQSMNK